MRLRVNSKKFWLGSLHGRITSSKKWMVLALLRRVLSIGGRHCSITILSYCYKRGVGGGRIALKKLLGQDRSQVEAVRSD